MDRLSVKQSRIGDDVACHSVWVTETTGYLIGPGRPHRTWHGGKFGDNHREMCGTSVLIVVSREF